ncbi:Ecm29p SCDLUD_001371 [Saccharomycodes ludwigii]|uniref:Ecm29p n=1 Tax=Saccharomycodes ludwigii TaxID=36035 RepID=UPI001E85AAE8|nr:hypothetical protein SCDLUD_001371 [Saccharomycodes ludwigii]KAH3901607.1 hypothetical protein SCDLUD_001371 [Saccharomycodes ludwigii]
MSTKIKQLDEPTELALIEKVELKLALINSPAKYSDLLNLLLPPYLLKLASPYPNVRNAVLNGLNDIVSRIKTYPTIKVPCLKLIQQAKSPKINEDQDPELATFYSLLLAAKGIDRIDSVEACSVLILECLNGISDLSAKSGARLFSILCKLLLSWKSPAQDSLEEEKYKTFFRPQNEKDLDFVFIKFVKFFLLIPAKPTTTGVVPRGYTCPGLSANDVSFFTYDSGLTFTREQLRTYKQAIFDFVTRVFPINETQLIEFLSVVSVDITDISDKATLLLRRLSPPNEDPAFINFLINLYTGNNIDGIPPVQTSLQVMIINVLNKSVFATKNTKVQLIISIALNSQDYKLRSQGLKFIQHVGKHNFIALEANPSSSDFSMDIASLIRNNLHTDGWPTLQLGESTPNFNVAIAQRRAQYETLGEILKKRELKDLSYVEFLIKSLEGDLPDFTSALQNSLTGLSTSLKSLDATHKETLKILIKKYLIDDSMLSDYSIKQRDSLMSIRFVILTFVNSIFPFDDAEARFFNVLGSSRNNRFDIIEESTKGLNPYWFKLLYTTSSAPKFKSSKKLFGVNDKEVKFPNFEDFVKLLLQETVNAENNESHLLKTSLNTAIRFCLQLLVSNVTYGEKSVIVQDQDWSFRVEKALNLNLQVKNLLKKYLCKVNGEWYLKLLTLLMNELTSCNGKQLFSNADPIFGASLLIFIRNSSDLVLGKLIDFPGHLWEYVQTYKTIGNQDFENACSILGIIVSSSPETYCQILHNIFSKLDTTPNTEDDFIPIIRASSSILARFKLRSNNEFDSYTASLFQILNKSIGQSKASNMPDVLRSISVLAKYGCTQLIDSALLHSMVEILKTKIIGDDDALVALTFLLTSSCFEDRVEYYFLEIYLPTAQASKQTDYTFAVGEALTVLLGRWESYVLASQLDVASVDLLSLKTKYPPVGCFATILDDIIEKSRVITSPAMIKSFCIWLLSIVQYLGHLPIVQERSKDIHECFMVFLSQRDEIVQESASRGLSTVYELADVSFKEEMVKSLLKMFTSTTTQPNGKIDKDTQLFNEGVLKTGSGSVSTYKDIMSLANEVGDPSLVYKFMSLARSGSLWASRKGVAFGLGAIMSKTSLEDLLLKNSNMAKRLLPKLYRYRFDPNESVSRSMNDIWKALISNSTETIDIYFEYILSELLKGMGNKEWRVREASTVGLRELIQTFPKEKYSDNLEKIWTMAFRTMDDIKESVRNEGNKLTRVVSNIFIHSLETSSPEKIKHILNILLPFLLSDKGLNNAAEEVREFSLKTLMNLIKTAKGEIKSYTPMLVQELCLLLSSLEPQIVNYMALNADKYNINNTLLDARRAHSASQSPIVDTIEKMIDSSDVSVLSDLVDASIKTIKSAVGLPSKVGSSKVINLLVEKYTFDMEPYCGKLLKACLSSLQSNNEMIGSTFAVTIGYLFKFAPLEKIIKYSKKAVELYFESSQENGKLTVGILIQAILNKAPSQYEKVSSLFIPLVFLAKNDSTSKRIRGIFENIWTESSGSESGTIKLYLPEITELISVHIKSAAFSVRQTCLKSVIEACLYLDKHSDLESVNKLFNILFASSEGRIWDGKEKVFEALVKLSITFEDYYIHAADPLKTQLETKLNAEILQKKNKSYSIKIISSYCKYLEQYPNEQMQNLLLERAALFFEDYDGNIDDENDTTSSLSNDNGVSVSKKQKTNSIISKKSTQKNIDNEVQRNNTLKEIALATKRLPNGEINLQMVNFVICSIISFFESEKIEYSWRSEKSYCEITSILVDNLYKKDIDKDLFIQKSLKFQELWNVLYAKISRTAVIESVKLQLVKCGLKLYSLCVPSLCKQIKKDLNKLYQLEQSSIVRAELDKNGFMGFSR